MEKKSLTPTMRRELKERYGTRCHVCGEEGAEYHHLIPLWKGGTDEIGNFIPLCKWHHMVIHGATSGRTFGRNKYGNRGGRKRKGVGGYKYILDDYFHCRIGTQRCKDALGLSKNTHITDLVWVKEYIEEKGIKSFRNNVDVLKKNGTPRAGKRVGRLEYKDGKRETFYWDDVREQ